METPADKSSPIIPGRRCEFHEPFGTGGTGTVFWANDLLTGNEAARKQMTVPTEPPLFSGRFVAPSL